MATKEEVEARVGFTLQGVIESLLTLFDTVIPGYIRSGFESLNEMRLAGDQSNWDNTVNDWVNRGFIDDDTGQVLRQLRVETSPVSAIATIMVKVNMLTTIIQSTMDMVGLDRQYDLLSRTTPNPAPVDALVRSMIIDPARATENRTQMMRLGYSDTQIDNIILSYYRTIDENTLRDCYLRGIIDEGRLYERMRELGYTDTRTQEIVQTWEVIPGAQDLFRMVAKEAFEPDIYNRLGLGAEFPEDQVEWLERQGISRFWAMKYWIAHWEQPSIQQGFEMLHRAVIDESELDMLFRAVEIPQYWRDRLTQIAYMPFTRVDVRRMHEQGVLTDEQLLRSYMDLGYDPEKALAMAEFTIRYNAGNDKELTRSTIVSSFKKGLINRNTASDLLEQCGYSEDLADYYLTYAEYEQEQETQDILFENIEDRYLINQISDSEARSMLNSMGMNASKIEAYLDKWNLKRYRYDQVPTKEELADWLSKGIITESQYRDRMHQRGYSIADVERYLESLGGEGATQGRSPTKADLNRWLNNEIITPSEYVAEMTALNYQPRYIRYYLQDAGLSVSDAAQLI